MLSNKTFGHPGTGDSNIHFNKLLGKERLFVEAFVWQNREARGWQSYCCSKRRSEVFFLPILIATFVVGVWRQTESVECRTQIYATALSSFSFCKILSISVPRWPVASKANGWTLSRMWRAANRATTRRRQQAGGRLQRRWVWWWHVVG